MFKFITLLCLSFLISPTVSWWCTGHQLVAQVAYSDLLNSDQTSLDKANEYLKVLQDLTNEPTRPFVEAACWPDQIKQVGMEAWNEWHFKDIPYFMNGFQKDVEIDQVNSSWAVSSLVGTIKNHPSHWSKLSGKMMKSMALRLIIHIVGDMHQPLHSSCMYSQNYPDGDRGGNDFKINYQDYGELHALWDAGVGKYKDDQQLPLTEDGIAWLENETSNLMSMYSRDYFKQELKKTSFDDWIEEAYKLAGSHCYSNIEEYNTPSEEYLDDGVKVAQKQITLAGYRLADLMKDAFKYSQTFEEQ